jgi:hypothetical protein
MDDYKEQLQKLMDEEKSISGKKWDIVLAALDEIQQLKKEIDLLKGDKLDKHDAEKIKEDMESHEKEVKEVKAFCEGCNLKSALKALLEFIESKEKPSTNAFQSNRFFEEEE